MVGLGAENLESMASRFMAFLDPTGAIHGLLTLNIVAFQIGAFTGL